MIAVPAQLESPRPVTREPGLDFHKEPRADPAPGGRLVDDDEGETTGRSFAVSGGAGFRLGEGRPDKPTLSDARALEGAEAETGLILHAELLDEEALVEGEGRAEAPVPKIGDRLSRCEWVDGPQFSHASAVRMIDVALSRSEYTTIMKQIVIHDCQLLSGYARMENCALLIEDGLIADVFSERRFEHKRFESSATIIDGRGAFVAPGLIDSHIHGFAGFGTEDLSTDAILAMSERLGRFGVTAFCPTIYPMAEPEMLAAIRAAVGAMGKESGAKVMGVHLEGPFISPERLGVQKPEFVRPVDLELMERLFAAGSGHITNMTIAPELKGMRELALYCVKKGIVLQAGHTNATYENMLEGMQAGVLHSTHFFNGMSRLHHRDPGAVGAIMIHSALSCEIIADGKHVHPDLIRLLMRDKPVGNIVLVTDSLKPTEQKAGPFVANLEEVILHDGLFHRKADDVIAGSSLTMIEGLRNLVSYGVPLENAAQMASSNPARILGLGKRGLLVPGYEADIVVFDEEYTVRACLVGGRFLKNDF
jgi:N-acetylglucosamine-6-phosphate deacetylase